MKFYVKSFPQQELINCILNSRHTDFQEITHDLEIRCFYIG